MLLIQILLVIFFIFAVTKVVGRYHSKDLSAGWLIFWLIFWLGSLVVAVSPNITFYFSKLVGIGRGADLVVYVSLVLVFFLFFKFLVRQEKMKKEITVLTRKIALFEANERKK
jgi:small membrane protein